ncbi:CHAD domain-containing protein [Nocardia brevicatena]|uniref:CHAD domain-containing protein n=1 Tax=Nocardia brevicatena TaxID=37327 RepID=UPI0002DEB574|nr:CHAD domain-containing protein [Nocardia brevicatena]
MTTAGAALTDALRDNIDRLFDAEPEVRIDSDDSVHRMRVATRRLRSVLRSYKRILEPDPATRMRAELAWLAGILGVARDAEVRAGRFAALLDRYSDTDSGGAALDCARHRLVAAERDHYGTAHADILAALNTDRYRAMREELSRWRTEPPLRESESSSDAMDLFESVLRRDRKRVRRQIRAEPTVAPNERIELLHDIRKSAKRLRYSCEAAAPVLGDRATALGTRAKTLQTILGDHRDAVQAHDAILARAVEARAAGEDVTLFGVLADAENTAAGRALAEYPAAAAEIDES